MNNQKPELTEEQKKKIDEAAASALQAIIIDQGLTTVNLPPQILKLMTLSFVAGASVAYKLFQNK